MRSETGSLQAVPPDLRLADCSTTCVVYSEIAHTPARGPGEPGHSGGDRSSEIEAGGDKQALVVRHLEQLVLFQQANHMAGEFGRLLRSRYLSGAVNLALQVIHH